MSLIGLILLAVFVFAPAILVAIVVYTIRALRPKRYRNVIEGEVVGADHVDKK